MLQNKFDLRAKCYKTNFAENNNLNPLAGAALEEIALKRLVRRREKSIVVKNQNTMSIKKSKKRGLGPDTKTMKRIVNPRMESTKRMMNLKTKWQRKYKSYRRTVGKRHFAASVDRNMRFIRKKASTIGRR